MPIKSILLIVALAILAFFHISFMFEMLRAPSDTKVMIGVMLIPLILVYPLAFKYFNNKIKE